MVHGFVKVCACTPEIRVADCAFNAGAVVRLAQAAAEKGAKLCVFPELCVTGYTCQDLFFQKTLTDAAESAVETIAAQTADMDLLLCVGVPVRVGGKLYNCAAVLHGGKILGLVPKTALPNYQEFYEARHFSPAPAENFAIRFAGQDCAFGGRLLFSCAGMPEFLLGVEICEDLWVPEPVSTRHALAGATVIVNLSASDEVIGKDTYRRQLVENQSGRLICGYLYCNAGEGESTQDMVFSGHSLIAENGAVLNERAPFSQKESLLISELDVQKLANERLKMTTYPAPDNCGYTVVSFDWTQKETELTRFVPKTPFIPGNFAERNERCERILQMQSHGLCKRWKHTNAKTLVLGISGGLDSCLALLVCVKAADLFQRPRTDVLAVTMPCFGTTTRTRTNAEVLCEKLGVRFMEVDITKSVLAHFEDIGQSAEDFSVVYENGQARERTQVLMDLANQKNGLVIGTGDLSELALGWATYNGDHMSMYGVNGSVPKTLVRHIVKFYADTCGNAELRTVLEDILDTPVSPELLPTNQEKSDITQKTEDIVGPYELHDFFLYYGIRWAFPPDKVYRLAKYAFAGEYAEEVILKWLRVFYRRFFAQQFKRSCLPDGAKIGSVTLSPRGDWRMPSDASAAAWLDIIDKL